MCTQTSTRKCLYVTFAVVFVLVCMFLSTLATVSACLVIHIGKGYEGTKYRAPAWLRNFAVLLSRLFRMTADDPMNRPDLEGLDRRQHEWSFISVMIDRLMFACWLLLCVLFMFAFFVWACT